MATVRFISPTRDLVLPGVPAQFVDFVFDIDDSNTTRLARMRYLGAPYGVRELGSTGDSSPDDNTLSRSDIAADISDPNSVIGSAIGQRVGSVDLSGVSNRVTVLESGLEDLRNTAGNGVVVGNEIPTNLATGALAARLRTY